MYQSNAVGCFIIYIVIVIIYSIHMTSWPIELITYIGTKVVDYLLQYCQKFGSKPCCYKDICSYFLRLLPHISAGDLLGKISCALTLDQYSNEEIYDISDVSYFMTNTLY